jgi:glucose/arabinose dehydrogenase
MNNLIALTLFSMCLGVTIGGLVVLRLVPQPRRWVGLFFSILAVASAALLMFMSSKYWYGDQVFYHAFVDIQFVTLAVNIGTYLLAFVVGIGMAILIGWIVLRTMYHNHWWVGMLGSAFLLISIFTAGTVVLIQLSIPEEEKAVSPVDRMLETVPGFHIELFATGGMISPTALAFGPDGYLYSGDIRGRIWRIAVDQGPGATPQLFTEGYEQILGLAWREQELYVASLGMISVIRDSDGDARADQRREIVKDLPVRLFPLHQNNNIRFGPDGRLYFGLGAGHNNEEETNDLTGTILSVNPDGTDLRVVARGLRNAYAVGFNAAGDLFATENGPQGIPVIPGDELNHIEVGKHYGYPGQYDLPEPQSDATEPLYLFPPHASPNGLVFYAGTAFPDEYRDNAFVTSWMRGEVYRLWVEQTADGVYTARAKRFAAGFKNPLDIVVGSDGNVYLSDFGVSAIYRIRLAQTPPAVHSTEANHSVVK